jgi:hypothetical protein
MKKADVVLVADGGSDAGMAPKLREQALALEVTILGLGIGVEREWLAPWCDATATVTDLTDAAVETIARLASLPGGTSCLTGPRTRY